MNQLAFAHPLWLFAGLAVAAVLVFAFRVFDRRNHRDLRRFVGGDLLARLFSSVSKPRRWGKRACFVGAVFLLFAALARPQLGHEWREVKRKGIDILFALDSSRSMLAEDVSPNRLERAKLGMLDFVQNLEGDRAGLLPFAGSAFLLCPLTLDYDAFRQSLDAIDTDIIPHKGTDLASAIREAGRAFEEAGNNHRILVVITDGEDLQGEALAAAERAAEAGMVVHTVGIGSPEGERIPIGTRNGVTEYLRDDSGQAVRSKLDEESLRAIASSTGGLYAPFGQHAEGLRQIYEEKLRLVPRDELSQRMQKIAIERFQWPLAAAIVLFLMDFLVGDRRRRTKKPHSVALNAPAATVIAIAAVLWMFPSSDVQAAAPDVRHAYNDGVSAYENNELEAAATAFQTTIDGTRDLGLQTRAYYNLGNTHFKNGAAQLSSGETESTIAKWESSLAAFDGARALAPDDADALFNRDLVQRKLDELKKEQEEEREQQQQQEQDSKQSDESESGEDEEDPSQDGEGDDSDENEPDNSESDENDEGKDSEDEEKNSESDKPDGDPKASNEDEKDGKKKEGEAENGSKPDEPQDEENPSSAMPVDGNEDEKKSGTPEQIAASGERREPGEMSEEEARQLLQALEDDEESILFVPALRGDPRDPDNTTKGKDW